MKPWLLVLFLSNFLYGLTQFETDFYPKPIFDSTYFIQKDAAGQFGVISVNGETRIPFLYSRIQENEYGLLVFKPNKSNGYVRSYSIGYYNRQLELILPVSYHSLLAIDHGRIIASRNEDGLFGLVDTSGKTLIPFNYQELFPPQEGLFLSKKNNKFGFINGRNHIVLEHQYAYAGNFSEGLAPASNDRLMGYINKKGVFVIPMRFTSADEFHLGYAQVFLNGQTSIVNPDGIILFPFLFTHIEAVGNDQFVFETEELNRPQFSELLQSISILNPNDSPIFPTDTDYTPDNAFSENQHFQGVVNLNRELIGGNQFTQVRFLGTFNKQNLYAVQQAIDPENANYNLAVMDQNGKLLTEYRFLDVRFDTETNTVILEEETEFETRQYQLSETGTLIPLRN